MEELSKNNECFWYQLGTSGCTKSIGRLQGDLQEIKVSGQKDFLKKYCNWQKARAKVFSPVSYIVNRYLERECKSIIGCGKC